MGMLWTHQRNVAYGDLMDMRRIFIIRKDLHLKPGKLAAMIGHCAEAYFTNLIKSASVKDNEFDVLPTRTLDAPDKPILYRHPDVYQACIDALSKGEDHFKWKPEDSRPTISVSFEIPKDIWNDYINGIFTKTICEARNLDNMKKRALPVVEELGLKEGADWGYINDKCLTDLVPENEDGTTTIGMWFKPLKDEDAFKISKKFKLYKDE